MSQLEYSQPSNGVFNAGHDKEWERKQRAREYRVAARREKRNRKADEKKQRKLNATILRRMTRNPDKYNKNAERNRLRAIEMERRNIYQQAVQQAQQLAAIHDPSGASFNVNPVIKLEDGTIITREVLKRREERQADKATREQTRKDGVGQESPANIQDEERKAEASRTGTNQSTGIQKSLHPDRIGRIEGASGQPPPRKLSKKQQKKLALYEPRPPPPKPTIPEGISIPEGEENWLALWHLPEDQVERRITREKKRKAAERKALRVKQQSGKSERRAARDEKRRIYREIKLEWKAIKEEQTRQRTKLKSLEDEESKKIAVQINIVERKAALDLCTSLGYTIENTPGTDEIKPKALGMKGIDVDFDAIEKADKQGDIRLKQSSTKGNSKRVDLGKAAEDTKAEYISTVQHMAKGEGDEFIKFDVGNGQDFQTLDYNHKLRRKLRRAIDNAEARKEMLVRDRAIEYFREKGEDVPPILLTPAKPQNVKGHRILDNGKLETAKQERVRARMELTEFNTQMKVLRRQAKDAAIYAGLKKHAELTGTIKESAKQGEAEDYRMVSLHVNGDSLASISMEAQNVDRKRSLSDSEDSSSDEDDAGEDTLNAMSMSEASSDSADSDSSRGNRCPAKRRSVAGKKGSK